ncbi:MAG: hypothetical protein KA371_00405 [Acidobacteria bacterium]|nr:hypothetical protein [Acidobacteriota bacterium]
MSPARTRRVSVDTSAYLCTSLTMPAVATPRSLGLAHLQTALRFHTVQPLDALVTVDTTLAHTARELGLPA